MSDYIPAEQQTAAYEQITLDSRFDDFSQWMEENSSWLDGLGFGTWELLSTHQFTPHETSLVFDSETVFHPQLCQGQAASASASEYQGYVGGQVPALPVVSFDADNPKWTDAGDNKSTSVRWPTSNAPVPVATQSAHDETVYTRPLHDFRRSLFGHTPACPYRYESTNTFQYATDDNKGSDPITSEKNVRTSDRLDDESKGNASTGLMRCSWHGCHSKALFKRKYELDRHMQKHASSKPFPCPVSCCTFSGPRAFYRKDKLRSHLREGHHDKDVGACPMPLCGMQLPLPVLQEHCRKHTIHETHNRRETDLTESEKQQLENLINAIASYSYRGDQAVRRCPIGDCKGLVPPINMQHHLQEHDLSQRKNNATAIAEAGYDYDTAQPQCPFCNQSLPNYNEWMGHVESLHLIGDPILLHEIKSEYHLEIEESRVARWGKVHTWRACHACQANIGYQFDPYDSYLVCSQCGKTFAHQKEAQAHNLIRDRLLQRNDMIVPHRVTVLKIVPEFVNHPVFDADWPSRRDA